MWFCCYSFGSQLYAWKNFLIAPAYRSGRFLHASLIELHRFLSHTAWSSRKCCSIHFLSLSAVSITASMMVLGESQTLHQVAPGSIAGKFATFSLNFALNPLLCSAVQPSSTRQFCILSIQSIPFKVGDVDAAPLPPIPVLEARTSAYVINCSAFGFQLCFPCFPDCYCRFPFIHCLIIGFCSVKSHWVIEQQLRNS